MLAAVIERLGHRIAFSVVARQFENPLLHLAKLPITALEQRHPLLVTGQRFLQGRFARLPVRGRFRSRSASACSKFGVVAWLVPAWLVS